jgi:Zn-dependent alcohol dehydrogenase
VLRGVGVGAFCEQTVVPESGVVRLDSDTPLDVACVVGCAIQTGVGAVVNTAGVEAGATVLVTGLGGIGISVVQGARLAGASQVIVSDPVAERREAALHFGATLAIDRPGHSRPLGASASTTPSRPPASPRSCRPASTPPVATAPRWWSVWTPRWPPPNSCP